MFPKIISQTGVVNSGGVGQGACPIFLKKRAKLQYTIFPLSGLQIGMTDHCSSNIEALTQ